VGVGVVRPAFHIVALLGSRAGIEDRLTLSLRRYEKRISSLDDFTLGAIIQREAGWIDRRLLSEAGIAPSRRALRRKCTLGKRIDQGGSGS
jgi:hypothetical protein